MTTEPLTVPLPYPLYAELHEQPRQVRWSLAQEVLHALGDTVAELDVAVARLAELADDVPGEVACTNHRSPATQVYLEELNHNRQREEPRAEEQRVADALFGDYEGAMVIRAEAMAMLTDCVRDITPLLEAEMW